LVNHRGRLRHNKLTGKIEREGIANREKIFGFIHNRREYGCKSNEIVKETGLSKQSVHKHLTVLLADRRVYKASNRRYFPEISIQNEMIAFAQSMKQNTLLLIDKDLMDTNLQTDLKDNIESYPKLELYQPIPKKIQKPLVNVSTYQDIISSIPDASMYLMKMLLGQIVSTKYCNTKFDIEESLQKCIFEFSNRIGAYIFYIFLQSMYPFKDSKISRKERDNISKYFIQKSISLEDILHGFRDLLADSGMCQTTLSDNNLFELSRKNFNILSKKFQEVYPNFYVGYENWWLHSTENSITFRNLFPHVCKHQWEKKYLFKFGNVYYCKKCHHISNKRTKANISTKQ
jgi:hypothetical protein